MGNVDPVSNLHQDNQVQNPERPECLSSENALNAVQRYFGQFGELPKLDFNLGKQLTPEALGVEHLPADAPGTYLGLIKLGEKICTLLGGNTAAALPDPSPLAAQAVMWYLKTQSILMGKGSEDEMHLIPGKEIFDFLKICGETANTSERMAFYPRISSHYKAKVKNGELIEGVENQFGFDLKLWRGKKHLLIGLRKTADGQYATFLKPESHGVPPFWKKGFHSWGNFKDYIGHVFGFIGTMKRHAGLSEWRPNMHTEKLNPKELAEINSLFDSLIENAKSLEERKELITEKKEAKQKVKRSAKRLNEMLSTLKEKAQKANIPESQLIEEMRKRIQHNERFDQKREIKTEIRKNNEIIHSLQHPVTKLENF